MCLLLLSWLWEILIRKKKDKKEKKMGMLEAYKEYVKKMRAAHYFKLPVWLSKYILDEELAQVEAEKEKKEQEDG